MLLSPLMLWEYRVQGLSSLLLQVRLLYFRMWRSLLVLAIVLRLLGLLGVVGCYRHAWGSLIVIHWRRAHLSIAIGALRVLANLLEL